MLSNWWNRLLGGPSSSCGDGYLSTPEGDSNTPSCDFHDGLYQNAENNDIYDNSVRNNDDLAFLNDENSRLEDKLASMKGDAGDKVLASREGYAKNYIYYALVKLVGPLVWYFSSGRKDVDNTKN